MAYPVGVGEIIHSWMNRDTDVDDSQLIHNCQKIVSLNVN